MAEASEPDSLRLFFALWPDDATRDALNRTGKWLHQHWGGRRMRADTLHLTLAFLGSTPVEQLDTLVACADRATLINSKTVIASTLKGINSAKQSRMSAKSMTSGSPRHFVPRDDGINHRLHRTQIDAFELILDQAGYWRHNSIGWLGASRMPPQYLELVGALNAALLSAGFAVDARPHVPHVTLLRNTAGGEVPECTSVHWPVSDFALVASRAEADGAHYDVIRRWPLTPQPENLTTAAQRHGERQEINGV